MYIYIYTIMKTMCPPGYDDNRFVATHALEHIMYTITRRAHSFHGSKIMPIFLL